MVDFSLETLAPSATPNPLPLRQKLYQGSPGEISSLAAQFAAAAGDTTAAGAFNQRAKTLAEQGYVVDNKGVSPVEAVTTKKVLASSGTNMMAIARKLNDVSNSLQASTNAANSAVSGVRGTLQGIAAQYNAEVAKLEGLPPSEREMRRKPIENRYRTLALQKIGEAGRTVQTAVISYEGSLGGAKKTLSSLGYVPPPGLNTGGAPAGRNADAARRQFFDDPIPPGAQRKVIKTDATVPGGKDGIIVSRMYIADDMAAFYQLHGDNRGPSIDPAASSRATVAWDTRTGEVSITVYPSTVDETSVFNEQSPHAEPREVGAWPVNVGQKTTGTNFANNFEVDTAPGRVDVKYDLINSGLPDPVRAGAVQGQTSMTVSGDKITGSMHGEDYPDREVVQYRDDGARILHNRRMGDGGQAGLPIYGEDYDTPRGQWSAPR